MYNIELLTPPNEIKKQVERLHRITGFVTILHKPDDTRPLVFARFYHVRRVVWLSHFISVKKIEMGIKFDLRKVLLLAWTHDLNRWPFSHNSEKGLFYQDVDITRYLTANDLQNFLIYEKDLKGIISKDYNRISDEAKIVLLADIVTGFIEDPLWSTIALNITWDIIPEEVADYLGMPINDFNFLKLLYESNLVFKESKSYLPVLNCFDKIFQELSSSFIIKRKFIGINPLGRPDFEKKRRLIKDDFMKKVLFAYNNEKISMGPTLKDKLILPFIGFIGDENINAVLTTIDEEQFIEMVVEKYKIISRSEIDEFLPKINYIEEFEPHLSFRAHYNKIKLT